SGKGKGRRDLLKRYGFLLRALAHEVFEHGEDLLRDADIVLISLLALGFSWALLCQSCPSPRSLFRLDGEKSEAPCQLLFRLQRFPAFQFSTKRHRCRVPGWTPVGQSLPSVLLLGAGIASANFSGATLG